MVRASKSNEHLIRNGREVREQPTTEEQTFESVNAGNWRAYELWLSGERRDALSGAHGGG